MAQADVSPAAAAWRVLIAGGPYWSAAWAALCPPTWTVVATAETLEAIEPAIQAHHPTLIVISEGCPGLVPWDTLWARVRYAAPDARVALVVEAVTPDSRRLIQGAAQYGVYHVLVGAPTADTWVATLTAPRTIQDVLGWFPDAPASWTPPPAPDEPGDSPAPVLAAAAPREVLVVSPAKPVILAVVGIAAGVGATCAAVGLAERLARLGQRAVLAEPASARTAAWTAWPTALAADTAPPDQAWEACLAQRYWSYLVVDCHTQWRAAPAIADRIVVVGPGDPHRWAYWSFWAEARDQGRRALPADRVLYAVAPGPFAERVADRVRRDVAAGAPVAVAADVFRDPAATTWDAVLGPLLPPAPPGVGGGRTRWLWRGQGGRRRRWTN
ncbi:MAG: hypothetical protein OWV35_07905 [Firmicutes bacterium]|nr:hypothetical protein [Bacillota bacterium]